MQESKPDVVGNCGIIEDLNCILEELCKESPNTSQLKARMKTMGLSYSRDPLKNMQLVLEQLGNWSDHGKSL